MDCGCKQAAPVHAMCGSLALVRPVYLASATCAFSAPGVYRQSASCWSLRPRSGSPSGRWNRPRQPALPSGLKLSGQPAKAEREPRLWQNAGWLETALATGLMLIAGDARGEEGVVDSGSAVVDSGSVVEAASGSAQDVFEIIPDVDSGSAVVDSGNAVEAASESAQDVFESTQDLSSGSAVVDSGDAVEAASGSAQDVFESIQDLGSGNAIVDSGSAVEAASGSAQDVFEVLQDVGSGSAVVDTGSAVEAASKSAQDVLEIIQGVDSGSAVVDSGRAVEAASGSAQDVFEVIQDADTGDLFGSVATSTISLLFVLAAVGLVVVTIGVVYLSISDYREKKDAEKDREGRPAKVQIEETGAAITGSGKGFGKKPEKVTKPEKVSKEKTRK